MNVLARRDRAEEFPVVRPLELWTTEEQEAATEALGLVEKMDMVKIQSYIDYKKQEMLSLPSNWMIITIDAIGNGNVKD